MKTILPFSLLIIFLFAGLNSFAQNNTYVKKKGMSVKQYKSLIKSDNWVLVDFYADWCGPCKKMDPFLEEIKIEMVGKLKMVRINADDNTDICNELSVYSLPTLFLYKNEKMYWFNSGYTSKEEIMSHIK